MLTGLGADSPQLDDGKSYHFCQAAPIIGELEKKSIGMVEDARHESGHRAEHQETVNQFLKDVWFFFQITSPTK